MIIMRFLALSAAVFIAREPVAQELGTITLGHYPLCPATSQPVKFRLAGEGVVPLSEFPHSGVEFSLYEYELYEAPDVSICARRRVGGAWGVMKQDTENTDHGSTSWNESRSFHFYYKHPGFVPGTFIVYGFRFRGDRGQTIAKFAACAAGEWPYADRPAPMWLQDTATQVCNMVLVGDVDTYVNKADFLFDVEQIVGSRLNEFPSAKSAKRWQLYYFPKLGRLDDLLGNEPAQALDALSIDRGLGSVIGVMHASNRPDSFSGRRFGWRVTTPGERTPSPLEWLSHEFVPSSSLPLSSEAYIRRCAEGKPPDEICFEPEDDVLEVVIAFRADGCELIEHKRVHARPSSALARSNDVLVSALAQGEIVATASSVHPRIIFTCGKELRQSSVVEHAVLQTCFGSPDIIDEVRVEVHRGPDAGYTATFPIH